MSFLFFLFLFVGNLRRTTSSKSFSSNGLRRDPSQEQNNEKEVANDDGQNTRRDAKADFDDDSSSSIFTDVLDQIKRPQNFDELDSHYPYLIDNVEELGAFNPDAAVGNPLKGLAGSPRWMPPHMWSSVVPTSLDFYYIGWDEVMISDPDLVGLERAFNWTSFESLLSDSANRKNHAVIRFMAHYPGQPLRVPVYLIDAGIQLVQIKDAPNEEYSPHYGDPLLKKAMQQFVTELGIRYDGDTRIAAIQLGLLGYWGEWHTYTGRSDNQDLIPMQTEIDMVDWYANAFSKTQLQIRYESPNEGYQAGFGRHDDSFAYTTLDGSFNGGQQVEYFFWPRTVKAKQQDFWKRGIMGGETRPSLQRIIFKPNYPAGTPMHQDFMDCVYETHATFMLHHSIVIEGKYKEGDIELKNALHAHARMGYNYQITSVTAVFDDTRLEVLQIDVQLQQMGVAPFYYPLSLALNCPSLPKPLLAEGVEKLIEMGEASVFTFPNVPSDDSCIGEIIFTLESPYLYPGQSIRFAQGSTGSVSVSFPSYERPATSLVPTSSIPTSTPSLRSLTPTEPADCPLKYECTTAFTGSRGFIMNKKRLRGVLHSRESCVDEVDIHRSKQLGWQCGPADQMRFMDILRNIFSPYRN